MRIKKISFNQEYFLSFVSFTCRIIFEKYFIKAIEDFRVSITSSKHSGKVGELSTVMQTLNCVSGLYNWGVSNSPNSPSCLGEALETRKTSSIA